MFALRTLLPIAVFLLSATPGQVHAQASVACLAGCSVSAAQATGCANIGTTSGSACVCASPIYATALTSCATTRCSYTADEIAGMISAGCAQATAAGFPSGSDSDTVTIVGTTFTGVPGTITVNASAPSTTAAAGSAGGSSSSPYYEMTTAGSPYPIASESSGASEGNTNASVSVSAANSEVSNKPNAATQRTTANNPVAVAFALAFTLLAL
uniref:CFEM domain-containing protein n=1 Tax=Mycena chlorophos TaxID=658473 RepID=A0ABQ0KZP0_MYCCL|nr:predicted protein [Mycena chlorophos]